MPVFSKASCNTTAFMTVHVTSALRQAPKYIATAHHHCDLNSEIMHLLDFVGHRQRHVHVDTEGLLAHQRLSGNLQQHTAVGGGVLIFSAHLLSPESN